MIGRKYSKSVISRLEALEAKKPGSLIFEVVKDGETKRVTFRELMEMRQPPLIGNDGIYYDGFPEGWRIVEGANMDELDEFINVMVGGVDKADGH